MLREVAFGIRDLAEEEQLPEILTGYEIDDYSPLKASLEILPAEDQNHFSENYAEDILSGVLAAELDHTHVHRLEPHQHLAAPSEH